MGRDPLTCGGAAYPIPGVAREAPGMTLLDHFAGEALKTILTPTADLTATAVRAYEVADAMVAERNRRGLTE